MMTFDKDRYLTEMKSMVDKAIARLKTERPRLKIFSVSIWTDPNSGFSSINFDSKVNSDKIVAKSNKYMQKKFAEYVKEGDLEMAELFKHNIERNFNPADFKLKNFETVKHKKIGRNWEEKSKGKCWKLLKPALTEVGKYALKKVQLLALENHFELAVNSERDWYDKTWRLK